MDMAANEIMAPSVNANCQYSTRYCWEAEKVKSLIRLRAELSPLFTGKRNASKYAWAVVERELNVPLPLSKIIKKWNNLLQEYKAIKMSEEPKRREWPFFTLMDVYFSDQVNDPSLRLFSSTKTLKETIDDSVFEDDPIIASAIAAATSGAYMNIDELIRRQKERATNDKKFTMNDYKYDMKPVLPNTNKFNSSEAIKLSKSVDDLSMQQYKMKDDLMRQREQEQQQDSLAKLKHHARQQHQQQQQRFIQHQQQHQISQQIGQHTHLTAQATPPPPPLPPTGLHAALQQQQQQQQNLLHHHHHTQQQQLQQQQQQQQHQHQHQSQTQTQQQQPQLQHRSHDIHVHSPTRSNQQHQLSVPPLPPATPPTTAQQIHLQTAQHQAAQQQLHQQQQQQLNNSQQPFTDPNTIDQYLLSWNNFQGSICRGFHTLLKDEKMVDVTIAAGGKIFKAHKLVLSVCSPYFQQILLENPSSHPILLMADVEANHMAGLLDFMYSGQVSVKYDDLPVFLKVAEVMKIKGLHTEKNLDDENKDAASSHESDSSPNTNSPSSATDCHFDRATHCINITGQPYEAGHKPLLDININGSSHTNGSNCPPPSSTFSHFQNHIKSKATLAETFMKSLSRNNNNNSNTSNCNYNHLPNSNNLQDHLKMDNYSIMQANSKKMLDSARKQHKYLAKRKILIPYGEDLNEKRFKEMEHFGIEHDNNNNNPELRIMQDISGQQQQQQHQSTKQCSSSNNFKIRLLENHHQTQNQRDQRERAQVQDCEDEEEALNLAQNNNNNNNNDSINNSSNNNNNTKNKDDGHAMDALAGDEIVESKPLLSVDVDDTAIQNCDNIHSHNREVNDDINNNNNNNNNNKSKNANKTETREIDDNNNNNSNSNKNDNDNNGNSKNKNSALLNAINRNMEHTHTTTLDYPEQYLDKTKHERDHGRQHHHALHHSHTHSRQLHHQHHQHQRLQQVGMGDEQDNNNNNNKKYDDNNNDNNNHHQLDLSTVKSIATAEILCGLKGKVFKMEGVEAREMAAQAVVSNVAVTTANATCRSLNEIRNAE